MCGIVGMASREPWTIDARRVHEMGALIRHRGPDEDGYFFADRAALGMRRLAIIDVAAGQQPMHNEDRSVWVVFNGEIYNYRELRRDLLARQHRLATHSDTECLVHLYEEYGDDCVSRLRGMFAFAIWDDRRKRLLLARDRLGIKPLYYAPAAGSLAFGSELKALLALQRDTPAIDLQALSDFFTFGYVPHPQTIYRGIRELPPAHVATWCDGAIELRRYWALPPQSGSGKPVEFYAEGLRHHLREAVAQHLVAEVPLGAFLSGGIDSSLVVALMSQTSDRPVKSFTVGFEPAQPGFDERAVARETARQFATEHTECLLSADVEEILPAVVRAFDEPFADSSVIPNFLICRAARQWVTVALSGLGGDELFGGYERYRGALLAGHYRRVPRLLRRAIVAPAVGALPDSRNGSPWSARLKRFVQGAELDLPERYQRYVSTCDEAEKAALFDAGVWAEMRRQGVAPSSLRMRERSRAAAPLDQMLCTDQETYLPDDELRKTDRISMCHSLEVRVPFLDHEVVEFAATIPPEYKIRRWQKKHVLVRAAEGLLSRSVLTARKQGFSVPLSAWLRGPLRDRLHATLDRSSLKDVGLFDPGAVGRLVQEHEDGRQNHETKLWALLTFMLWHGAYVRDGGHRGGAEGTAGDLALGAAGGAAAQTQPCQR